MTRSSLTCISIGISPISSRKSVPLWASSNLPGCAGDGARKSPLLMAEKFALHQVLGDGGAVDLDEGFFRRGLLLWMALATSSLPVPVSPVIRMVVVVGATLLTTSNIWFPPSLAPTMSWRSMSARPRRVHPH